VSGDLLVQPAASADSPAPAGSLAPGVAVPSSFTVTNLTAHTVTLRRATVTGVAVSGRHCTPHSADVHVTSATVEGVRGVVIERLEPAVFTVDLTMGHHASAACAGARFTPQVTVRGTDAAGHPVAGTTTASPTGWTKAGPPLAAEEGSSAPTVIVAAFAAWILLAGLVPLWRGLRRRRRA